DPLAGGLFDQAALGRRVAHRLQHLLQEHRFERLRRRKQLGAITSRRRSRGHTDRRSHRTTTAAVTAPAARKPSNTATTSLALAPRALRPAAISCTVAPGPSASIPSGWTVVLSTACDPTRSVNPANDTTASPTVTIPPAT